MCLRLLQIWRASTVLPRRRLSELLLACLIAAGTRYLGQMLSNSRLSVRLGLVPLLLQVQHSLSLLYTRQRRILGRPVALRLYGSSRRHRRGRCASLGLWLMEESSGRLTRPIHTSCALQMEHPCMFFQHLWEE